MSTSGVSELNLNIASRKNLFRLRDVYRIYGQEPVAVHALDGVALDIHAGDFMAIIGPSGSGKSTLLGLLGCLDLPTKGSIKVDLSGQVAVVTGASQGLGKAMAIALGLNGARVACLARNAGKLAETVQTITDAGGKAEAFSCDVKSREEAEAEGQLVRVNEIQEELCPRTWDTCPG